jgi:heavy metal translocating P-type ATPase
MKINALKNQWQMAIAIFSLLAIAASLIIRLTSGLNADLPLLIIIAIGGILLLVKIAIDLCRGDFGADLLAAIALVTAICLQEYLAATLLIFMLASGQSLELYATGKASSVLAALANRMPNKAHLQIDGKIEEINASDIKISDQIIIYPHEICPIDGLVTEGASKMDESYLTGEPYQISKIIGSNVLSGAINGDGVLVVMAEKLAADSRYSKIMQVMIDAEQKRPKLRRLSDQLGMIFTPLALIMAFLAWYFSGSMTSFLAVLVIATPCPLLIAIPITIISAISMAARHGIIIKDPAVLERLATCRTAIFDKTGTLTYGHPQLTKILNAPNSNSDSILQKVASLERYSRHPLASAILAAAQEKNLILLDAQAISEKPGQGLMGKVDGQEILITSRQKLGELYPDLIPQLPESSSGLEFMVVADRQYLATFCFHDAVRKDSQPFISHLLPHHKFNKIILLSGDRESEVNYLAQLLGITETYASQSPEDKVRIVQNETKKAPTLFMGDGINDAPALAVATVGLAFGQNSNITSEAAGAVIMENNLAKADELIHISILMRRIAAQSAIGGMVLSFIGMILAAFGLISPVSGALIQEIIDIIAILNALRMTWQPNIATDIKD